MSDRELPAQTELLVIGGGPGGYAAALRASDAGLAVTLVEREALGGTCLNHGCIPSKALLTATRRVDTVTDSEHMGIYAEPYVDVAELVGWKDGVVERLTDGIGALCRAAAVDVVSGEARFLDASRAQVEGESSGELEFETAVVSTGSRPISISGFDFGDDPVWDSRQALAATRPPERLVVVGAGYVGMELATVFARLGTDVTVVEMLSEPLPGFPDRLTDPVLDRLDDLGVEVRCDERARGWRASDGDIVVETETDEGDDELVCDRVLVAVGREPVAGSCDPGAAGLTVDDRGFIETGEYGSTDIEGVYAVGDVAGEPMLAHAAMAEGVAAAAAAAGERPETPTAIPAVVYTDPEIATVGATESDLREAGRTPTVGRFPFAASGRALSADEEEGFVEVVAADGMVVGGHIVGPKASELVGELTVAVETGLTLSELARTVHAHPTLSEAVGEAADDALGYALHAR